MMLRHLTIVAALLAGAPAAAATTVITFDQSACILACNNGTGIRQDFGDTAAVDVSYAFTNAAGDSVVPGSTLQFWNGGYSGSDAVYAASGRGQIRFDTLLPGTFTLNSVDFGGWPNATRAIDWRVYTTDYNLLASGTVTTNPVALTTVSFGQSSSAGLIFQFGPDGFNGGVQNVNYSFTTDDGAIPEPSSWAMLIAGFGLTGAALRRRRLVAAA